MKLPSSRDTWIPLFSLVVAACSSSATVSSPPSETEAFPRPPSGPQPDFGPLVHAKEPPPPITGGTLSAAGNGVLVAADTDRDRIYVVDVPLRSVRHSIELPKHSEPGRVAIDDKGRAHVVLRRSGALATVDLTTGALTSRSVCSAPRGVAFDAKASAVHVACATGELVTIPEDGSAERRTTIARDLRDVVVRKNGTVSLSRFRTSEILRIDATGRSSMAAEKSKGTNLAWRTVVAKGPGCEDDSCETEAVVEQEPSPSQVSTTPGGYGGGGPSPCAQTGIVGTKVDLVGYGTVRVPRAVLPVDLAINQREAVVVAAGNAHTKSLPQLFIVPLFSFTRGERTPDTNDCFGGATGNVPGEAVAAVFDDSDQLIVQTREPAAIHIMAADRRTVWKTISLSKDSVEDTGHAIFHSNAGGFIACASCHAEGGDDGHTWTFVDMGPRRTPSLLGTIANTEPFHWDGDMKDLRDLVDHVFVERMSGPAVDDDHLGVMKSWLFALPPPSKLRPSSEASARGALLFAEKCSSCHAGERLTNNQTLDVGTGGRFQVPSLIGVGWRSPFLHSGCAPTLADRFGACGGSAHGDTKNLTPGQISDLVEHLETL